MASISISASAQLDYSRRAHIAISIEPGTIRTIDQLEEEFLRRLRQARKEIVAQLEQLQDAEEDKKSSDDLSY